MFLRDNRKNEFAERNYRYMTTRRTNQMPVVSRRGPSNTPLIIGGVVVALTILALVIGYYAFFINIIIINVNDIHTHGANGWNIIWIVVACCFLLGGSGSGSAGGAVFLRRRR